MCDDNEECGKGDAPSTLAMLLMPAVVQGLERFMAHMKRIIPDFGEGADADLLQVIFCAGRTHALQYVNRHNEVVAEAMDHQTAMSFAAYAERHGHDIDWLNESLEKTLRGEREESVQ